MSLPTDAKERKDTPIYSGFVKYFPLAMAEVARLSKAGNDQHNPGKPLHWDRSKSGDELDALQRHLLEAGTIDTDGQRHSAKVAWRAMGNLEKELERAAAEKLVHEVRDSFDSTYNKMLDAMVTGTYGRRPLAMEAVRETVLTQENFTAAIDSVITEDELVRESVNNAPPLTHVPRDAVTVQFRENVDSLNVLKVTST